MEHTLIENCNHNRIELNPEIIFYIKFTARRRQSMQVANIDISGYE